MQNAYDKTFQRLIPLLTFLAGIILAVFRWFIETPNEFWTFIKITSSVISPYIIMALLWIGNSFVSTEEMKIRIKLLSWSILSIIFIYYIEIIENLEFALEQFKGIHEDLETE